MAFLPSRKRDDALVAAQTKGGGAMKKQIISRVRATDVLGRTMLVRGLYQTTDSETVVSARLETGEEICFAPGVAVRGQLGETQKPPLLPSWAKLVPVESSEHRIYHKFEFASTIGWERRKPKKRKSKKETK
jgi:hypothetical protein